jgi:hypothetical protein
VRATLPLFGALLLAACQPAPGGQQATDLVTEQGTLSCGGQEDVYTNHGTLVKELHVRVSQACDETDSIIRSTRILVRDARGNVDSSQTAWIMGNRTHRGTFLVPGGSTLQIICGSESGRGSCSWEYRYALKP